MKQYILQKKHIPDWRSIEKCLAKVGDHLQLNGVDAVLYDLAQRGLMIVPTSVSFLRIAECFRGLMSFLILHDVVFMRELFSALRTNSSERCRPVYTAR